MIEASKKSDLVSYPIRDIVQEAKRLEKQGTQMTYLNIGDPAVYGFKPPEHIRDAVVDAVKGNYTGYAPSEGDAELRAEVAKYEGVAPDDVYITSGLSEGIEFLYQAMLEPGRNFLLPEPCYPLYLTKSKVNFGVENFYACPADTGYEPDVEDMRKKINKLTQAIVVINPNNPTGAVYSPKTLQAIVDLAGEYKLPIIADDAYEMLVFDGKTVNMREICKDVPLISGNSMSKNFVYPGARVGYVAFHGEEWTKVKDATRRLCNQRLSINWEQQRGMIAALKGSRAHLKQLNSDLKDRRDLLVKRVNEIDGLELPAPKGAFYAFVEITDAKYKDDWQFVRELLKDGVVVVPGSAFAPTMQGQHFRLVFLTTPQVLNHAMDKIDKFMKK